MNLIEMTIAVTLAFVLLAALMVALEWLIERDEL